MNSKDFAEAFHIQMYRLSPHTKKFYFERNSVWINLPADAMTKPKSITTNKPTWAGFNCVSLTNFYVENCNKHIQDLIYQGTAIEPTLSYTPSPYKFTSRKSHEKPE